eukprot:1181129-Prorocentrum_minimum.AAC.1
MRGIRGLVAAISSVLQHRALGIRITPCRAETQVNHSAHSISNIPPNIRRIFPAGGLPLAVRQSTPGLAPWQEAGPAARDIEHLNELLAECKTCYGESVRTVAAGVAELSPLAGLVPKPPVALLMAPKPPPLHMALLAGLKENAGAPAPKTPNLGLADTGTLADESEEATNRPHVRLQVQ